MKNDALRGLLGSLLLATPMAGCCPPGSNQAGPSWNVTVPASQAGGLLDGGEVSEWPPDSGMLSGGGEAFCEACAIEKNCPTCASDGYMLYTCEPTDRQPNGDLAVECMTLKNRCVGGRRPAGLHDEAGAVGAGRSEAGRYFAEMSRLEAASVIAFRRLLAELRLLGAPARLLGRARQAARDEVRHVRVMARLALRHGAAPINPTVAPPSSREAEEVATENAVEGCVGETWGALLVGYQARAAFDPAVRANLAAVAEDEMDHAALAWAVADFLDGQLTDAGRRRVRAARDWAAAALLADERPFGEELRRATGLPSPEVARALLAGLSERLWAA